jgi:hypothetical protein
MGVIEDLQAIRAKEAELQRERAKREADLDVAKRHREEAFRVLQEEFEVSTIEEAEAELERRGKQFEAEVRSVVERLREVS